MARVHCRCRECRTRRVLPKAPDRYATAYVECGACGKRHSSSYVIGNGCDKCGSFCMNRVSSAPACGLCGARNYIADRWMNKRDTRKAACMECGGYWFPHRKGSLFCHFRKDGSPRIIGDNDFRDRRMSDVDVIEYLKQCAAVEAPRELEAA